MCCLKYFKEFKFYGIFIFIILSLLLTGPAYSKTNHPDRYRLKKAEKYLRTGEEYYNKGDLEKAEKSLKIGLEIFPEYHKYHKILSHIFFRKGDFQKALSHIEKAENFFELALDKKQGITIKKIQEIKTLIMDLKGKLTTRAESQCRTKAINEPIVRMIKEKERQLRTLSIEQDITSVPEIPADYFYFHGNIYLKMKKYSKAKEQYKKTIISNPKHKNAYNNLVVISCLQKQPGEASSYINLASKNGIQLNPKLVSGVYKTIEMDLTAQDERKYPEGVKRFIARISFKNSVLFENTYVVFNKNTRDAIIIDPGAKDPRIEKFISLKKLKVKKILNTHAHFDHTGANKYFAQLYQVKIAIHKDAAPFFNESNKENRPTEFVTQDRFVPVKNLPIKVIHTPGHTPGSTCFLINGHLFSGDTLFKKTIGSVAGENERERIKNMNALILNIKEKLLLLPEKTIVFPGHGNITSIANEISHNIYLNKSLALDFFKKNFTKLDSIYLVKNNDSKEKDYDITLVFKNSSGMNAFKKSFGENVLGLKLNLISKKGEKF